MKRTTACLVIIMLCIAVNGFTADKAKSVSVFPPSVVKTVPECGSTAVSSKTTEIKVTFSKEMTDGCWSWCMADRGQFPEMVGQPKYLADKKTCVLTVKLKPKTTYALWLNTQKHRSFKDKDDRPAVPYLLVFETK